MEKSKQIAYTLDNVREVMGKVVSCVGDTTRDDRDYYRLELETDNDDASDVLQVENVMTKCIFSTNEDGRGPHARFFQLIEAQGEEAIVGKKVKLIIADQNFTIPYKVMGEDENGKLKQLKNNRGGDAIGSVRRIVRYVGEGGSIDGDARANLRQIMEQTAKGGGFIETVKIDEAGNIVEQETPNADKLKKDKE